MDINKALCLHCELRTACLLMSYQWIFFLSLLCLFVWPKLKEKRGCHLGHNQDGHPHDPLLLQVVRKGHRRRTGMAGGTARVLAISDCMDNSTQTDISFQSILGNGPCVTTSGTPPPPPSPPLPPQMEPYLLNDLWVTLLKCAILNVVLSLCW